MQLFPFFVSLLTGVKDRSIGHCSECAQEVTEGLLFVSYPTVHVRSVSHPYIYLLLIVFSILSVFHLYILLPHCVP